MKVLSRNEVLCVSGGVVTKEQKIIRKTMCYSAGFFGAVGFIAGGHFGGLPGCLVGANVGAIVGLPVGFFVGRILEISAETLGMTEPAYNAV